jgi:hypothetical protein
MPQSYRSGVRVPNALISIIMRNIKPLLTPLCACRQLCTQLVGTPSRYAELHCAMVARISLLVLQRGVVSATLNDADSPTCVHCHRGTACLVSMRSWQALVSSQTVQHVGTVVTPDSTTPWRRWRGLPLSGSAVMVSKSTAFPARLVASLLCCTKVLGGRDCTHMKTTVCSAAGCRSDRRV